MDLQKTFKAIEKNTIIIDFDIDNKEPTLLGASKLGGQPDLPPGFEWPYYEGEGYEGKCKNRPLSFLAQINCSEVKPFDVENKLPESGILSFFYELDSMTWGFDPKHKGSARVFYYDADLNALRKTEFPADLDPEFQVSEIKLMFSNQASLPDYAEFYAMYGYDDYDGYYEERAIAGFEYEDDDNISKLLGYADVIQNDMQLECEKVTNGMYCGTIEEIEENRLAELEEASKQWNLLFQLDTIYTDEGDLMFGDCGRIYYYIKDDDLKKRNFDNCWLILQCG